MTTEDQAGAAVGGAEDPAGAERVDRGLEHLQRAARELIAASRAFLDVAEEVVEDPTVLRDVATAVTALTGSARRRAAAFRPGSAKDADPPEASDGDGPDEGLERIRIS